MNINNAIKFGLVVCCTAFTFVFADGMRAGRPVMLTTTRVERVETTIEVQADNVIPGCSKEKTLMDKVLDVKYKGQKLTNSCASYLDNMVYTLGASHKMGTLNDLLAVVNTILQTITQKKKSFAIDTDALVKAELQKIIDEFGDFAALARGYAKVIIPLMQESLAASKFALLHVTKEKIDEELKEPVIMACVKSKEDVAKFFVARIKTEDDLALFVFELQVFLKDLMFSCPKAMALYRRSLK